MTDLAQVDVDVFLGPFLAVVRSEATTGPITGVALSSINKFLSYGLIDTHSPQAASGIENIADAVTHAKFVGTDLASDEVVLMKILQVLRTILLTPVGSQMSNESVCELMQSCFRICFEMRLSELLRKSAEQTLTDMIHLLFSRLGSLSPPESNGAHSNSPVKNSLTRASTMLPNVTESGGDAAAAVAASAAAAAAEIAAAAPGGDEAAEGDAQEATSGDTLRAADIISPDSAGQAGPRKNVRGVRFTPKEVGADGELIAYGVPCIRELFRFLISLINPRDRHNNETMMSMGLALLTVALETGGGELSRFPALMEHLEDGMCKNLFSLLKTDNLTLYAATLRVIFLAFEAQRHALKFQMQIFLTKVCEMEYQSYEHKEGVLDTLLQLCRIPHFLMDLYLNFDCSLYCDNLFETVLKFLSTNAYPEDRVLTTHLNALDCLLSIANEIGQRDPHQKGAGLLLAESQKVLQQKVLMVEGVALFKTKPKKGIKFFQEKGMLADPLDPAEVSRFLRNERTLDKIQIGEMIAGRDFPEVRPAYVKTFDFSEMQVDEALRSFLCCFRLPGESILIERIMEAFANEWYETFKGDKVPKSADATFILLYAIIQLNVDQHNERVKNPMTIEQFCKNQRGLNGDADFPFEFLNAIYTNIKENEIILPSEQKGDVKDDFEWQLMLGRARDPKNFPPEPPTALNTPEFDQDIFNAIWGPTITALCYVLDTATEEALVTKLLDNLQMCAAICSRFEQSDVFDNLIVALCKRMVVVAATTDEGSTESEDIFVSNLGENVKVQLTAKMTFALIREHGNILRHGWQDILDVIAQLFQAQLMPEARMVVFDFLTGGLSLTPSPDTVEPEHESSFISSFFFGSAETKPTSNVSDKVVAAAKNCVEGCAIGLLFSESVFLQDDSLLGLCKSLISLSQSAVAYKELGDEVPHDELMAIFFLELLAEVAVANKNRIQLIWEPVMGHLRDLITCDPQYSRLAEHALINLMRIGERLYHREEMAPTILQSLLILQQLPVELGKVVRPQIMAGLASFVKANVAFMKSDCWDLVMALLLDASYDVDAVDCAIDALMFIVSDAFTPQNAAICQQTAIAYVETALESTVNIEILNSDETTEPAKPLSSKLLDLLHAVHVAVPHVYPVDGLERRLWNMHWESLLQSMARFCTVVSRSVRQHALTMLQSSLMLPDLNRLAPEEWQTCLENVLFPLMDALLEPPAKSAPTTSLEEIRMRTCALLCKVFLQHLNVLLPLESFTRVWLRILGFMEKYLKAGTELAEAVPETLKNMLLVMSTAGILAPGQPSANGGPPLWELTWTRIEGFIPGMCAELFPDQPMVRPAAAIHEAPGSPGPAQARPAFVVSPEAGNPPQPSTPAQFTFAAPLPVGQGLDPSTPAAAAAGSPNIELHSTPIQINM